MADNGRLTVNKQAKVVLFYAESKSVVATQRSFLAHVGTRSAILQTFYKLVTFIAFSMNYSIHSHVLQQRYYEVTILMG
jgi:hypothetical protein